MFKTHCALRLFQKSTVMLDLSVEIWWRHEQEGGLSWPRNGCCGVNSGWRSERKVECLPGSKEKKWLYSSSWRLDGQKAGRCEAVNVAVVRGTLCVQDKPFLHRWHKWWVAAKPLIMNHDVGFTVVITVQQNCTYAGAGCQDRQLSGSARSFG